MLSPAKARPYWSEPGRLGRMPTSTPVLLSRAHPRDERSLSRIAAECLMERHERDVLSTSIAGKALRVGFDGGRLTSDAGVLVLADIERRLRIAERLARRVEDPRSPGRVHHTA